MAIRTIDELLADITNFEGDNTSDRFITLLEDSTDTLNDLRTKIDDSERVVNEAVAEKDKEWRERYVSRFRDGFSLENKVGNDETVEITTEDVLKEDSEERITKVEDLFEGSEE